MKRRFAAFLLGLLLTPLMAAAGHAERQVTDQLGRQVTLPDSVSRAVVLQHQTLNLAVQMNATGKVVGILDQWKQQLGANYARLAPELAKLAMPGGLTKVNIEALLQLKPDVVFVTNYAPAEMIGQIEKAGVPVIAISLLTAPAGEAAKVSPVVADEEAAYESGFAEGVRLIGTVLDRKDEAEALIATASAKRRLVAERLAAVTPAERVSAYMANPDLATYGSGKYTGIMMKRAGAANVAAELQGFKQVTMEQVLKWNPAVIFVQERYPAVVEEIKTAPAWQPIRAVKAGHIYLMPEYAKAWGYPMPEAMALGELWMAKKLYPERFADIDMQAEADAYYKRFYRTGYDSFH
ncbi:ABC transporter substrate-binding protein [Bosea sp. (in: a-proteobacteria)]|uniref:ABC transporter substrate-binding protein n=1 Tax=Bosea sp. (in: a-proteobacteria) TaxID=1871050 RepID=UPI002618A68B|nr:ABC transporter substrate-binding protein [Bosea sp. (in: a-proteobacteria)]MCO5089758.1 ABC transporter substrate-binding protein [Bosea sp. (in: a-proteobacteria)]